MTRDDFMMEFDNLDEDDQIFLLEALREISNQETGAV